MLPCGNPHCSSWNEERDWLARARCFLLVRLLVNHWIKGLEKPELSNLLMRILWSTQSKALLKSVLVCQWIHGDHQWNRWWWQLLNGLPCSQIDIQISVCLIQDSEWFVCLFVCLFKGFYLMRDRPIGDVTCFQDHTRLVIWLCTMTDFIWKDDT